MQTIIISIYNSLHMSGLPMVRKRHPYSMPSTSSNRRGRNFNGNNNHSRNRSRSPLREKPQIVRSALNNNLYAQEPPYEPRPIPELQVLSRLRGREEGKRKHTPIRDIREPYRCTNKITLAKIVKHADPGDYIYYKFGTTDELAYQVVNNNGIKEKRLIREGKHNKNPPLLYWPFKINTVHAANAVNAATAANAAVPGGRRRSTRKMKRQH